MPTLLSSVSLAEVVAILGTVVSIGCLIWLAIIWLRKDENTRERFAFASLAAFSAMTTSVISAIANERTLFGLVDDVVRKMFRLETRPDIPHRSDHFLMLLLVVIFGYFILRIYDNWQGAVSVRQYEMQRYRESAPLISEGIREAVRIVKRQPREPIFREAAPGDFHHPIHSSYPAPAWHVEARDLILLRSPDYEIDALAGWHDNAQCWIGLNRKTQAIVAVRCSESDLAEAELLRFAEYIEHTVRNHNAPAQPELILAGRQLTSLGRTTVLSYSVLKEDYESLLHGLVDFRDYFNAVRDRVERIPLPDSALRLKDIFVSPKCSVEGGSEDLDLQQLIFRWIDEPGERQVALLGEYGQGKSTAAWVLAYRVIHSGPPRTRIPIIIELRGKSPANMTPEELVASWAYPYRINPQAVMKLIAAGRTVVILEGFDEMSLVGSTEMRLSHFETLWKFCIPNSKVLITGRPNYFLDDAEMRAALGISKPTAAGPYCEAVRLVPFNVAQIEFALRHSPGSTREEIVALAVKDPKFLEIVSRGSLLYVVSQLWERERLAEYAGRINSAVVMQLFIQHSYRRQTEKGIGAPRFMILNESERKYFMRGVGAYMGSYRLPNQITPDQFGRAIRKLYDAIPERVSVELPPGLPAKRDRPLKARLADVEDPVVDVANDVRSAGILVPDDSKPGALRFAHKSFMEFLIAEVFARHTAKSDREETAALISATGLIARDLLESKEAIAFYAEILTAERKPREEHSLKREVQHLFSLIVLGGEKPNGYKVLAARYTLLNLVLMAQAAHAGRFSSIVRRLISPDMVAMFIPVAFMELLVFGGLMTRGRVELQPQIYWAIVGVGALALVGAGYLTVLSRSMSSSINLWVVSSTSVGANENDFWGISRMLRPKTMRAIAAFLNVALPSHPNDEER